MADIPTSSRRLLVTTQVVDRNDPYLGFFHDWLAALAPRFASIEVICLREGTHALPANVRVHTLGRERGRGRLACALRFLWLSYTLLPRYDAVFVHMNPEYIVLSGDVWRLTGKKVALWYNHEIGSVWLKLAASLASVIFHTSPYAYPARYKQAKQMPAGVDTDLFKPSGAPRAPRSVYFQARVVPAKRQHVALAALTLLKKKGIDATLSFVGPEDAAYAAKLRAEFADLFASGAAQLLGPKPLSATPGLYATHTVAVNLTAAGNFDKTVLEAMASETPVVVSSRAFAGLIPAEWLIPEEDAEALAAALERLFVLSDSERETLGKSERAQVVAHHSLAALVDALASELA